MKNHPELKQLQSIFLHERIIKLFCFKAGNNAFLKEHIDFFSISTPAAFKSWRGTQ